MYSEQKTKHARSQSRIEFELKHLDKKSLNELKRFYILKVNLAGFSSWQPESKQRKPLSRFRFSEFKLSFLLKKRHAVHGFFCFPPAVLCSVELRGSWGQTGCVCQQTLSCFPDLQKHCIPGRSYRGAALLLQASTGSLKGSFTYFDLDVFGTILKSWRKMVFWKI